MRWLALLLTLFLAACNDDRPAPQPGGGVPSRPGGSSWTVEHGTAGSWNASGDLFAFTFPSDTGGIDYVTKPAPSMREGQTITVRYRVSGPGKLDVTDIHEGEPRVHVYFQQVGDNMSWEHADRRQWSRGTKLENGEKTINVQLVPGNWRNVGGKESGFRTAIAQPARVGLTFGGANMRTGQEHNGHGVYAVGGEVKFELLEFSIK